MANGRNDAERGAYERARHFGDQFFARVGFRPKQTEMISAEAAGVACPMTKLVEGGSMPIGSK